MLDAQLIQQAFSRLDEILARDGAFAEVFVVGGAAMTLLFPERHATMDVDAVFTSAPQVRAAVAEVGEELGLPPDWLNDAAKGFLEANDPFASVTFQGAALRVLIPSLEYLLASKLAAARVEQDADDIKILVRHLGIPSAEEALELVARYYPPNRLLPRTRYLTEEIFQSI